MALTKLQFAIYAEIRQDGGKVHGYEILKRITNRGLAWSHQQVYRELNKMYAKGELRCEIEPIEGKPDRKIYSLVDGMEYKVSPDKLSLEVVIAYPRSNLVVRRYKEMKARVTAILKELNQIGQMTDSNKAILELEMNRLEVDINALVAVHKSIKLPKLPIKLPSDSEE